MKKKTLTRILGLAALCCASPSAISAQSLDKTPAPRDFYQEGKALFAQKAYAASLSPLQAYLRQTADEPKSADALTRQAEAEYMLACAAYELGDPRAADILRDFLATHPDTPHANRVQALIASTCFFDGDYAAALDAFSDTRLEWLSTDERDDMTYRLAVSHLQTGDLTQAAVWFETLRATSPRYEGDCTYYISYIRYTQGRLDEALPGFLGLQSHRKYQALVPYYIAEIYLAKQQFDKAEIVAQNYLSAYPDEERAAEMQRVLGTVRYHAADWPGAMTALEAYRDGTEAYRDGTEDRMRRDAAYMLGLAYCHNGVYSEAPAALGEATLANDALAQNAYLHMGLAYLQLGDKNKARMAFEQAAVSDADRAVKEQAAYNYALCIHETAYHRVRELPQRVPRIPIRPEGQRLPGGRLHEHPQLRGRPPVHRAHQAARPDDTEGQAPHPLPAGHAGLCQCRLPCGHRLLHPRLGACFDLCLRHPRDAGAGRCPLLARRILLPPGPHDGSRRRL